MDSRFANVEQAKADKVINAHIHTFIHNLSTSSIVELKQALYVSSRRPRDATRYDTPTRTLHH
jgi:hypothetical protein